MASTSSNDASDGDDRRLVLGEQENDEGWLTGQIVVDASWRVETDSYPSEGLPVDRALRWARSAAAIVVLDAGGHQYSAGKIPEPGLVPWIDGTELRTRRFYEPPGPAATHFWVSVTRDGSPLDPELLSFLRADPEVRKVRADTPAALRVSVRQRDDDVSGYLADVVRLAERELGSRDADRPNGGARPVSYRYSVVGVDRR